VVKPYPAEFRRDVIAAAPPTWDVLVDSVGPLRRRLMAGNMVEFS
jgi:hypothetical protein